MEYVDITNSGTYDFLYLRIDFQNRCKFIPPIFASLFICLVSDTHSSISLIQCQLFPSQKLASEQNGLPSVDVPHLLIEDIEVDVGF